MVVLLRESRGQILPCPLEFEVTECLTIGRDIGCDVLLYDPDRRISRLHAVIHRADGLVFLRPVSRNLPVLVNGLPTPFGLDRPLAHDDEIVIGSYAFRVAQAS